MVRLVEPAGGAPVEISTTCGPSGSPSRAAQGLGDKRRGEVLVLQIDCASGLSDRGRVSRRTSSTSAWRFQRQGPAIPPPRRAQAGGTCSGQGSPAGVCGGPGFPGGARPALAGQVAQRRRRRPVTSIITFVPRRMAFLVGMMRAPVVVAVRGVSQRSTAIRRRRRRPPGVDHQHLLVMAGAERTWRRGGTSPACP